MKNVILTYKMEFEDSVSDDDAISSTLEVFHQDRHFPNDDDIDISPIFILDEWDIKVIKYLKKTPEPKICGLAEIWGERNAIDILDVNLNSMVERLVKICSELKLISVEKLFYETFSDKNCKNMFLKNADYIEQFNIKHVDHTLIWLGVLCSVLINTEIKKIPGYE